MLRLLLRSAASPRPLQRWVAPALRRSRARFLHDRRPKSSVFVHLYSSVVDVVLFIIIVIFGVCSLSFSLFCFYPSRGDFSFLKMIALVYYHSTYTTSHPPTNKTKHKHNNNSASRRQAIEMPTNCRGFPPLTAL
jgi:hypothetical protein